MKRERLRKIGAIFLVGAMLLCADFSVSADTLKVNAKKEQSVVTASSIKKVKSSSTDNNSTKQKNTSEQKNTSKKVSKVSAVKTTSLSEKKLKLSWNKANGADKYKIYQRNGAGKYRLIGNTKEQQMTISVEKDKEYTFKVFAYRTENKKEICSKETRISFSNKQFVSIDHQKYSYSEMVSDMKALAAKYSDYVSYTKIGTSEEGRDLYDIVIGNPEAKKTLFVIAELHAREYVTTVTCMKQLEYYLMNYNQTIDGKKPADLFSNVNLHCVVMANPDGAMISQSKKPTWKANAKGVNLNNNFPYHFKVFGSTSRGTYSGSKAGSAKETQAIIELTKKLAKTQKLAVVNYHAMGEIVFGDYGGKDSYMKDMIKKMYETARKTTGYASAASYGGSGVGNYREYLSYVVKVPSITIEVGNISCPLPQKAYSSIFEKNKYVILREAALLK